MLLSCEWISPVVVVVVVAVNAVAIVAAFVSAVVVEHPLENIQWKEQPHLPKAECVFNFNRPSFALLHHFYFLRFL